jgi:sulfopyruvate decarboxylase alpha subunit
MHDAKVADTPSPPEWATGVADGLRAAGCLDVIHVPDTPLSRILDALNRRHPDVRTVLATREEEAVGIAAGLYLGGARPALLMQSSGIGNILNAVGSLLLPYRIPTVIVVSLRGDSGEWNSAQVPMGRAVTALLDTFGIRHVSLDHGDKASATVQSLATEAFATGVPTACLLPRRLTVPREGGRP